MFRIIAAVLTFILTFIFLSLVAIVPVGILTALVWLIFGKIAAQSVVLILAGTAAIVAAFFSFVSLLVSVSSVE